MSPANKNGYQDTYLDVLVRLDDYCSLRGVASRGGVWVPLYEHGGTPRGARDDVTRGRGWDSVVHSRGNTAVPSCLVLPDNRKAMIQD